MVSPASQAIPSLSDTEAHAWFGFLLAHATLARQVDADLLAAHRLELPFGFDPSLAVARRLTG